MTRAFKLCAVLVIIYLITTIGGSSVVTMEGLLPCMQVFDLDEDPSTVAQRWAEWDSAMGLYMDAINIVVANQHSTFLYSAGKKVWDIVDKMEDVNTLQKVWQKLAAHFEGQMNEVYETFQFLHVQQGAEESMDAFYRRLQAAAKYCNLNVTVQPSGEQAAFTVSFKDHLCNLIVLQCYSSKL